MTGAGRLGAAAASSKDGDRAFSALAISGTPIANDFSDVRAPIAITTTAAQTTLQPIMGNLVLTAPVSIARSKVPMLRLARNHAPLRRLTAGCEKLSKVRRGVVSGGVNRPGINAAETQLG